MNNYCFSICFKLVGNSYQTINSKGCWFNYIIACRQGLLLYGTHVKLGLALVPRRAGEAAWLLSTLRPVVLLLVQKL